MMVVSQESQIWWKYVSIHFKISKRNYKCTLKHAKILTQAGRYLSKKKTNLGFQFRKTG